MLGKAHKITNGKIWSNDRINFSNFHGKRFNYDVNVEQTEQTFCLQHFHLINLNQSWFVRKHSSE